MGSNRGTYQDEAGKPFCKACQKGEYGAEFVPTSTAKHCLPCAHGRYSSAKALDDVCIPCNPGRYGNISGATSSETACSDCKVGTFTDNEGSLECTDCGANETTNGKGQSVCSVCAAGRELVKNSTGPFCEACETGKQSRAGDNCKFCSPGYYASIDKSRCLACEAGKHGEVGLPNVCNDCPPGRYSKVKGTEKEEACTECPRGEFSNVSGSRNNSCTSCPRGTFARDYGSSSCESCAKPGFFCEEGATKETDCDAEELSEQFYCYGAVFARRPEAPPAPRVTRSGFDGLNVSLPGNETHSYRVDLHPFSKQDQGNVMPHTEAGATHLFINNLNMGTQYYVRFE